MSKTTVKQNKMAVMPVNKLMINMGIPMIVSMMLQAVYNIVDSAFVANMEGTGELARNALTLAFPVQICCCLSFGILYFSLCEKVFQATGKSVYSTIAQIAGANIAFQGIFQALNSGLESLIISVCRQFLFVIPVAYIFSTLVISGVWHLGCMADLLNCRKTFCTDRYLFYEKSK